MFKSKKRTKVYSDQWLTFYHDEIIFPDGSEGAYSWVDRKNGVGIVVVTTENKILLNKEYRYVIDAYSWEIPGGGIDKGETPDNAAKRELYEETGIKAKRLNKLGVFYPLNSFNNESITIFFGIFTPKFATTLKSESGEHVSEQRFVSFKEALKMIDRGEITDAVTAASIQMVVRKLLKN